MVDYSVSLRFVYSNGVPVGRASVDVFDTDTVLDNSTANPFDTTDVRDRLNTFQTNENGWISGTVSLDFGDAPRLTAEISKDGVTAGPIWFLPNVDQTLDTHWTNGPKRCLRHEDPNPLMRDFRFGLRQLVFQVQQLSSLPGSSTPLPRKMTIMKPIISLPDPLDTFTILPAVPPPQYIAARYSHAKQFTDAEAAALAAPPPEYSTFADYRTMYASLPVSIPKPISVDDIGDGILSDDQFCYERIAGVNPRTIARVGSTDAPSIPPGFDLPEEYVRGRTGLRLDELQSAHRLYVCDYSRLAPLLAPFKQNGHRAQTAVALFFYGRRRATLPAGIARADGPIGQLVGGHVVVGNFGSGQPKPVPGPSPGMTLQPLAIMVIEADGTRRTVKPDQGVEWDKAKIVFQVADTTIHELDTHLWSSHFAMEPIVLSMIRQLDDLHPLRELLIRHSYGLIWINNHGIATLIEPTSGQGHKLLMLGFEGMASVMGLAQGRWTWRSTQLKTDLTRRGMDLGPNFDQSILSYPYRDDGLRVLEIIRNFTGEYVDAYYDNDHEVGRDSELAAWLKEMATLGVPLLPGISTKSGLADFLADFIFQMSAGHAAINAPQWNYSANSLDKPGYLRSQEPPANNLAPMFPRKKDAIQMMSLMGRLATFHWEQGLGFYRDWNNLLDSTALLAFPDGPAEAAAARFRDAARALHDEITADNGTRRPYTDMMPLGLDNSTHT